MTKKKGLSLEQVRQKLEESRELIDRSWVKGTFFVTMDENGSKVATDDPHPSEELVGVCLAGSVLYSMGYDAEQWEEEATLEPIVSRLHAALYELHPRPIGRIRNHSGCGHDKDFTRQGCELVVWNDVAARRKGQVLELFDRAIKRTIQEMELS